MKNTNAKTKTVEISDAAGFLEKSPPVLQYIEDQLSQKIGSYDNVFFILDRGAINTIQRAKGNRQRDGRRIGGA